MLKDLLIIGPMKGIVLDFQGYMTSKNHTPLTDKLNYKGINSGISK